MALAAGTRLGPYEILAQIGTGGMGDVYRATDTRLHREVAIKISAERFSDRFEREARAISAHNHQHICTLYDIGPNYLVMELVEGETLASRLKRGKLSIDNTLRYGAQIADAMAAAHAKGIVHRDLKPGNIMLTKVGVKVLDFGLAKSQQDETLTMSRAVMGTPAYMAPEQREGKECDARTDIYALGLVLAEMATGKRLPPDTLPTQDALPERLAHVIDRCLARDPQDRWQSARDINFELEWVSGVGRTALPAPRRRIGRWTAAAAALVLLATIAFLGLPRPRTLDAHPSRLTINAPTGADFLDGVAISPDGRTIVFAARISGPGKLWIRPLASLTARALPGTEGAAFPFWSPDSRSIGYFLAGKLRRMDVASGVSTVICNVGLGRGGTWNQEGTILFNSVNDGPLLRVSAAGGTPVAFTRVDTSRSENSHRFPYFLPDGHKFLYYIRAGNEEVTGIYLGSLDRPQKKTRLLKSPTAAIFVPAADGGPARLLWVENGTLLARPFDAEREQLGEEASALDEKVRFNFPAGRFAQISVAKNGTIVYGLAGIALRQLTWYGRDGKVSGAIGPPDSYIGFRISPDGTRAAVTRAASASHSGAIALLDMTRGVATPLIEGFWGAWAPDGERIAYTGGAMPGSPKVQVVAINGTGKPEQLTTSEGSELVLDWSADGRYIMYCERSNNLAAAGRSELWVLPLADRKPFLFAQAPRQNPNAQFSPDGQWVAYASLESGRLEVYVRAFPAGRKWQISNDGGDHPRWRKDGHELLYLAPGETLMSVSVKRTAEGLEFTSPKPLFRISVSVMYGGTPDDNPEYPFDISSDGRILALAPAGESEPQTLVVMSNWGTEVQSTATRR